jgi:hypothetical protein
VTQRPPRRVRAGTAALGLHQSTSKGDPMNLLIDACRMRKSTDSKRAISSKHRMTGF